MLIYVDSGGVLRFRIEDAFDSRVALEVREGLAKHSAALDVQLEFVGLKSFSNLAVALLAPLLAARRVTLRGLSPLEERSFQRFGIGRSTPFVGGDAVRAG